MTSVCSLGLDMVPIPGDTDAETLAALMADELAIGVFNQKTTATRLIPVPGKTGRRHGLVRRPVRRQHDYADPPGRPKRPLHPPRRPHPRAPLEPAQLGTGGRGMGGGGGEKA